MGLPKFPKTRRCIGPESVPNTLSKLTGSTTLRPTDTLTFNPLLMMDGPWLSIRLALVKGDEDL